MPVEITPARDGWSIALDLAHDDDLTAVVRRAVEVVREAGGGATVAWVKHAADGAAEAMASEGFVWWRDLLQLRVPLPLAASTDVETRAFVVGQDEAEWIDVNNRAFHWHPEQGGWTVADVREREAEPWFDPEGFRLHEIDGRLAAFCWTKVHRDHAPPLGEIYVIAVDPDFQGRGLGTALAVAGLDHVCRAHGIATGMLYVEADNEVAIQTYRSLGFTTHHVDRAFRREV